MSSCAPTPEAPPPPRVVTDADVVAMLRAAVAQAGSQRAFVKAVGVNEGDLSSTLRGRRPPSPALRRAVGVETRLVHVGAAR
ncbi:hypothetical protein BV511_15660 [Methylorubrum extorquens]|uniref:hypothetical protein n=1 Tax=Methylorubrum extorquens TaxID=408 RepID=UPI0009727CA8|nr:hypothetical protein [Methylorubrum extorquens]APX86009.1 hypothetical protein BV511_15660 [Methylorubrum extorquens]